MPIDYSTEVLQTNIDGSSDKSTTKKVVMLARFKIDLHFEENLLKAVSQQHNQIDKQQKLQGIKTAAIKYFQMMIEAIQAQIKIWQDTRNLDEEEKKLAWDAINDIKNQSAQEFIDNIINKTISSGQITDQSIEESVAYHTDLLLRAFYDDWLPLITVRLKLSQIAACIAVILKSQETYSRDVPHEGITLAQIEPQSVPTYSQDVSHNAMPLAQIEPQSRPTTAPQSIRSNIRLILGGVTALGLIGTAAALALKAPPTEVSQHPMTAPITAPRLRQQNSNIQVTAPIETTTNAQEENIAMPVPTIISASSRFGIEDQAHSPLEEGVRRALLTQTEALGHCLRDPNDAIYLAHGLRRPITDQLRRANWQIGNVSSNRGITITWTDNGLCNDIHALGWELNDAGTSDTIYPSMAITIATDIATITRNQKLYHRLPVVEQR